MAASSKSINRNTRFHLWSERYKDNETFGQLQAMRTRAKTLRDALTMQATEHAATGDLTEQGLAKRMQGIREATRGEITKLRESVVARARHMAEPLRPTVEALPDAKLNRLADWWASATFDRRMNAIREAITGKDNDLARAICTEPRLFPVSATTLALVEKRFVPEHDPTVDDLLHASKLVDEELEEIEKELS